MDTVSNQSKADLARKRALLAELLQKKARQPKHVPLSFAQQRLWFLHQLAPDSPFYNISRSITLRGHLQRAALEQSLNELVRRHEALRTRFAVIEGRPVQVIEPGLHVSLSVEDLTALASSEREAVVYHLAHEEARRPFDLANGPLIRTCLLYLGEQEHVLLLTMHHIISDGWSMV